MNFRDPLLASQHTDFLRRHSRRSFLQVGLAGGLGLTLGDMFRLKADQKNYESKEGVAKSVIHIFLPGGIAHQETFDPKPYAPQEYRGPLGSIETKVPGLRMGEHLKATAQIADRLTVVNSMTHGEAAHEFGPRHNLPPYVCVPSVPNEYAQSGYLSSAYGPFSLGSDPASKGFKVQDLALPGGIDEARFAKRRSILQSVDSHFASLEKSDRLEAMDTFYQRAYALISSDKAREAFDINKEPGKLREEYGRNPAGQRMLMARRLVEAGVRLVSLTYGGWDHHDNIAGGIAGQLPQFDKAFARLITDLEQRGLLDSTLVMVSSEFGRTPKINTTAGRDHWPKVFSIVLAGGGIKKGSVYGKSDAIASEPEEDPLSVADLACTVYHQLGINSDKELMAPGDRPIEIVDGGNVIKELLA
jgi:uncharacterized protein (DUF1501 family)